MSEQGDWIFETKIFARHGWALLLKHVHPVLGLTACGTLIAIGIVAVAFIGNVKDAFDAASPSAFITKYCVTRPKPTPGATPKYYDDAKKNGTITYQSQKVAVPVVAALPPKVAKKFEATFDTTPAKLEAENKALITVQESNQSAPRGVDVAVITNKDTGEIETIFTPKKAPFAEFGGQREVAVGYDPLKAAVRFQYRQDLGRIWLLIANVEAHGDVPMGARALVGSKKGVDFGASISGVIRW